MYNEKIRKLTSLMLMTVMVAGGLTFAAPGVMPAANAADDELYVSAQEIGNFAGIQVIEIVVDDSDRSDTNEEEGRPNVEIDGNDVYMAQGTDGSWYAYVVSSIGIDKYANFNDIYKSDIGDEDTIDNSEAVIVYANATSFLDGVKTINTNAIGITQSSDCVGKTTVCVDGYNNDADALTNWPFIQSFAISEGDTISIKYGTGTSAESVDIKYDYDDDKDIKLDRQKYPSNAYIHISTDDSLLNLSPVSDESWVFFTNDTIAYVYEDESSTQVDWDSIGFEEGPITVSNSGNVFIFTNSTILDSINEDDDDQSIILKTSNTDDNLFVNYDNSDHSGLLVVAEGESSIAYTDGHSVIFDSFNGALGFVGPAIEEWLSGVEIELILTDEDKNLNSRSEETINILDENAPYIEIGFPTYLDSVNSFNASSGIPSSDDSSESKVFTITKDSTEVAFIINATYPYATESNSAYVFSYVNFDFTAFGASDASGTYYIGSPDGVHAYDSDLDDFDFTIDSATNTFEITFGGLDDTVSANAYFDILSFGQVDDVATNGEINDNVDRVNDAIYRFALEETDDNTAKFDGTLEYIMINQLNVFDENTYDRIDTADDSIIIIVNDDMDGADAVTVSYNDLRSSNALETISVTEDANTHTGSIELDSTSYSSGNTIEVTLIDVDLNTDSDTIQTYDVDSSNHWVGDNSVWLSQLKIGSVLYNDSCTSSLGLDDTGFTFTETGDATGIFVGTFKLPAEYCDTDSTSATTNGLDLKFEYQDYSDASGEPNETSESASIRSNTGSVALDQTVYPVPFADGAYETYDNVESALGEGTVVVTIQVNDPDFNLAANGEDKMDTDVLKIVVARGSENIVLWAENSFDPLDDSTLVDLSGDSLVETDPESGIFEIDVEIKSVDYGFSDGSGTNSGIIYQGDILTVTYEDPNDASGDLNTVTDSATFDLRNAVLQTDKKEYIIGSDAIITLIEPDLNLDSDSAETWSLDLINWDSDGGSENLSLDIFDANPAGLRETGDNTGIFQVVIEIPRSLDDALERGELITLEYQDNGPAGADYIGDDDEDIITEIKTSDFGASITLDQKVYTWTDKVYVTIVSPDHNFDSNSIDEIGTTNDDEINVSTRDNELENYKLVETGPDTGIFTGEIILTGFAHDADGVTGDDTSSVTGDGTGVSSNLGPTNGYLRAENEDGLSISFESSDRDVVIGSALIRWNIGEVQWLEASYPASGSGVVRVIDPDMNWNPESVDSFDISVWSDTAVGGISLGLTETNEATGIFEGTVFFTTTQGSSGSRLAVNEGDSVTAEYEDNTLPDPYSTADELGVTAVANIGTIVPPLERAPAGNLHAVDAFGNSINTISIDQQIQIEADVSNNQDRNQAFAYLVQIQDQNGVTVMLSWIKGDLTPGQELSSSVSWIPTANGDYTVTAFVWESVNNPTALSPPVTTVLSVR